MKYPQAVLSFIAGPVRVETTDGGRTILTHLQKFSRCGFMVTWPFCFHLWFFWKKQEFGFKGWYCPADPTHINEKQNINWLPGTERGVYARTPGYRWDVDLGMKWTWGYFGAHWD